jgi:hypothetical protein
LHRLSGFIIQEYHVLGGLVPHSLPAGVTLWASLVSSWFGVAVKPVNLVFSVVQLVELVTRMKASGVARLPKPSQCRSRGAPTADHSHVSYRVGVQRLRMSCKLSLIPCGNFNAEYSEHLVDNRRYFVGYLCKTVHLPLIDTRHGYRDEGRYFFWNIYKNITCHLGTMPPPPLPAAAASPCHPRGQEALDKPTA